jgi:putative ABC transport system substrate-binding protein
MNRRQALFALSVLGLGLPAARESSAQPTTKTPVIGLLDAGERLEWWAAFRQQLRDLGYVEGQNVAFEARFARGTFERLPTLAEELVRRKVAVIVTSGSVATQTALRATTTIPIVTATGDDPVSLGVAESLARPGGNVTGVTSLSGELTRKRFELLREVFPKIDRLAVLWHRDNPGSANAMRDLEAAARSSKVALRVQAVKSADELTGAFSAMTQEHARAVFVIADPLFFSERRRISDLAIKHKLPSIYGVSDYVEAGGLLSYGASYSELFRRAAVYVDKILKGAKPGDLPIEQPTKLELVINLKTARALGVAIPRLVLLRADQVIE